MTSRSFFHWIGVKAQFQKNDLKWPQIWNFIPSIQSKFGLKILGLFMSVRKVGSENLISQKAEKSGYGFNLVLRYYSDFLWFGVLCQTKVWCVYFPSSLYKLFWFHFLNIYSKIRTQSFWCVDLSANYGPESRNYENSAQTIK